MVLVATVLYIIGFIGVGAAIYYKRERDAWRDQVDDERTRY